MAEKKFKTTLSKPIGKMGKALEKNFKTATKGLQLENVDNELNEKEQSFKKKIFDLAKMESLVHGDEILNGIYNKMAETGEEDYGYHHNETIMNILFNKYVLGNSKYLQKYKMAIPVNKKRRDKSGTRQLQQKLGTTSEPNEGEIHNNSLEGVIEEDDLTHGNFGVTDGMGWDVERDGIRRTEKFYNTMEEPIKEVEEQIEETTSAGGSAGAIDGSSRADGYTYVGPFGKRNNELDKPIWKGGQVIGESEYLYDPQKFKEYYNFLNEGLDSPNNDSRVPIAEYDNIIKSLEIMSREDPDNYKQMLERTLMSFNNALENLKLIPDSDEIKQGMQKVVAYVSSKLGKSHDFQLRGEDVNVDEHHLDSNEDKTDFITNELKNLSAEELTDVYNQIEKYLGMIENVDMIDEKAKSKAQQRFMGTVYGLQKGDVDPSSVSGDVKKAASSMKRSDAKDFASTKHDDLPEKVKEDYNSETLTMNLQKKLSLSDLLHWANENVLYGQDHVDVAINDFATSNGLTVDQLKELSIHYLEDLGFDGTVQTSEQEVLYDLVQNIKEISDIEESVINEDDGSAFHILMNKFGNTLVPHLKNDVKALATHTQRFLDTFFNGKSAEDVLKFIGENPDKFSTMGETYISENNINDGIISQDDAETMSMDGDNQTTMAKTMKDIQEPMPTDVSQIDSVMENTESVCKNCGGPLDEDGYCRKDEVPIMGKKRGAKGACKKKKTLYRDDSNKYNVAARMERKKEREKKIKTKKDEYKQELDKHKKHMKKMKKVNEGEIVAEDKRPSSLVNLDRLKKDNEKNFKSDMKNSNTVKISADQEKLLSKDKIEQVGDNPYKRGEEIEAEKLKDNKGKSFDNVGDSANANNKEIPKRNFTDDEDEQLSLDRGKGQHDWKYDLDPSEKFEERMKNDIGEELYDLRKKKMEYREKAHMYNKDSQPVHEPREQDKKITENKELYSIHIGNKDKQQLTIESKGVKFTTDGREFISETENGELKFKAVKSESLIMGKYRNKVGQNKFVDFKISEAVEVEKDDELIKLDLTGMGNIYDNRINENVSMRDIMDNFEFYLKGNKVVKIKHGKQALLENEEKTEKQPLNEEIEKMRKLYDYNPSDFVSTSNVKKNRNF